MRKQIENLIEKVGNVTNNITNNQQNIFINSHGDENLEYITKNYLSYLLKMPFGAVPQLIKDLHFNPKHPENNNVKITNKKLPYAQVFKDKKWVLKDKKQVIDNMVDTGFNLIDGHYFDEKNNLNPNQDKRYRSFQDKYDGGDKQLKRQLNKETELAILNQSK